MIKDRIVLLEAEVSAATKNCSQMYLALIRGVEGATLEAYNQNAARLAGLKEDLAQAEGRAREVAA
jgi:hypothetical protein